MNLAAWKLWIEARLRLGERGGNLVEYVLLLVLIAMVVIVAVRVLGGSVSTKYSSASSEMSNL